MSSSTQQGKLFYVIGASGAGKDSLLNYVRPLLADQAVVIGHRYITRAIELTGENHIHLTEAEFHSRQKNGCFLFSWQSHGLSYGIGIEVQSWLDLGLNVVINGSRGYLDKATDLKADIIPVLISVSQDKLRVRLEQRGREQGAEIDERLARAREFEQIRHANLMTINNDAALEVAGQQLYDLLTVQDH